MLNRLIEYVCNAPAEDIGLIALQDMSVCLAWYRSYSSDPEEQERIVAIRERIDAWRNASKRATPVTTGRRHQWVLRELIDEIENGHAVTLMPDELELLLAAYELAHTAADSPGFERVCVLLEKYRAMLKGLRDKQELVPGLPTISGRLHVISEADIREARVREIKVFAGVNLPGRGPVFTHKSGHLRVLGNIPENTTVVVEDGSCSIDGFVMGRVAAAQHCEVRENISGVVIVRQGDVRARNIILRAHVVSKWGHIFCRSIEYPTMVFAGAGIHVEDGIVMGTLFAPEIIARNDIMGGSIHITRMLTARRFRRSNVRELSIVLRPELSAHDYGEEPGPEAARLLAQAGTARRNLTALRTAVDLTTQEAEHSAEIALAQFLGSEKHHPVAERLATLQKRLTQIQRLVSSLRTLATVAEDRLQRIVRYQGLTHTESSASLSAVSVAQEDAQQDFNVFSQMDSGIEGDIRAEITAIATMKTKLQDPSVNYPAMLDVLTQLREHIARWDRDVDALTEAVKRAQAELRELLGGHTSATGAYKGLRMVQTLRQVLTAAKERATGADDPLGKRLQNPALQQTIRTVNSRVERLGDLRKRTDTAATEFNAILQRLKKEFQLLVAPEDQLEAPSPRVTGAFEPGIKLFGDAFLLQDQNPPSDAVVLTRDSGDEIRTYYRDTDSGRVLKEQT